MISKSFITMMAPFAEANQKQYKVPASVCIAQAALETGWGKSVVGNNYFGIKATPPFGTIVSSPTMECIAGKWICVEANFCAYTSLRDCVNEYGLFLQNKRYAPCFATTNSQSFCMELQSCGYATDPNYGEKLISIINQFNLIQYDLSTPTPSTIVPSGATVTV